MADQGRYSRQDLADMFRRCTSTIDKWRKRGIVPEPNRTIREPWWTDAQVDEIRIKVDSVVVRRNLSESAVGND